MKKFIFAIMAILFLAFIPQVQAQKVNYAPAADTVTNAETIYVTYPNTFTANSSYAFGITADTLSGTNATVKVTLMGMVETDKWVAIGSEQTIITTGGAAEASYVWTGDYTPYLKYRIRITQTGTATTRITTRWVLKTIY